MAGIGPRTTDLKSSALTTTPLPRPLPYAPICSGEVSIFIGGFLERGWSSSHDLSDFTSWKVLFVIVFKTFFGCCKITFTENNDYDKSGLIAINYQITFYFIY